MKIHLAVLMLCLTFAGLVARAADYPAPQAGNFVVKDFQFKSGEKLAEVKLHYYTLGAPEKDTSGTVRNAVLILHGTGGSGRQFLMPSLRECSLVPASFWMPPDISSFCLTTWATAIRASPATACTCASLITNTTT